MRCKIILFIITILTLIPGIGITGQIDWVKYPTHLDLDDGAEVSHPSVLFANNKYHLWYVNNDRISYARSTDGVVWEEYPSNPVLRDGPDGDWDGDSVSQPSVVYDGALYRMWFTGYDGGNLRIGYATSTDGVAWNKHSGNPVLNLGASGNWDDAGVSAPSILYDGRLYRLFYTGYDGSNMRIGYAVAQVPLPNPLLANAGSDVSIYPGSGATLNGSATGGTPQYNYAWSPITGLNNPNIANPTACPTITTTYTLTVTDSNSWTAQDEVVVTVSTATALFIQPATYSLTADDSVAFTGIVRDSDGNTWTVTSQTTFTTNDPAGTMSANVYPPGKVGTWIITATYSGFVATATVNVTYGTTTALFIQPATYSLTADDSVAFTGIVRDSDGNTWTVTSQTTFTTDDPAGTMTANVYHPGKVGTWIITATYSGFVATATVNVTYGTTTAFFIQPATYSLTADDSVAFTGMVRDSDGNTRTVTLQTTFTTDDPAGTMSANVYHPGKVGTWIITATYSGFVATATVNVTYGTTTAFFIQPATYSLTADDSVAFTGMVRDSDGNTRTVTLQTTFVTDDPAGTMTDNLYFAGRAGTWTIAGTYTILIATATVRVTHGSAASFKIRPGTTTLTADEQQAYRGTATDSDGNQWDVTGEISWSENDPTGTMGANIYYAGQAGTWTITGTYTTLVATATVVVTPGAFVNLSITVPATVTTTIAAFTLTASLSDRDGNPYSGPVSMTNTTKSIIPDTVNLTSGIWTGTASITKSPNGGVDTITVDYQGIKAAATITVFISCAGGVIETGEGTAIEFIGTITTDVIVHIATSTRLPEEFPEEELPGAVKFAGIVYDIELIDAQNNRVGTQTHQMGTVAVYLAYPDKNQDGWVDGTNIREHDLIIYHLEDGEWRPLETTVNGGENVARAYVPHFSIFALAGTPTITNLREVSVYPNPVYGGQPLHFKRLTGQANIKIFNIAGELVKEIEHANGTDEEAWANPGSIASGIYIYLITNNQGQKAIGKLGVIK